MKKIEQKRSMQKEQSETRKNESVSENKIKTPKILKFFCRYDYRDEPTERNLSRLFLQTMSAVPMVGP